MVTNGTNEPVFLMKRKIKRPLPSSEGFTWAHGETRMACDDQLFLHKKFRKASMSAERERKTNREKRKKERRRGKREASARSTTKKP